MKTVKEIKKQLVQDGWSKSISLRIYTKADAERDGNTGIASQIERGKQFFKMNVSSNVFNARGEIAVYNI